MPSLCQAFHLPVEDEAVNSPSGGCDSVSVDYSSPSVSFSCQFALVCQAALVQTKGEKGGQENLKMAGCTWSVYICGYFWNSAWKIFFYYCYLLAAFLSYFSFLLSETTAEIVANDSVTCWRCNMERALLSFSTGKSSHMNLIPLVNLELSGKNKLHFF